MRLCERVGWPAEKIDLDYHEASFLKFSEPPSDPNVVEFVKTRTVDKAGFAAIEFYFMDEFQVARMWAERVVTVAEDYFFGAWRDQIPTGNMRDQPPDRTYYDRTASWQDEIREALHWSFCLRRWDAVERFASYPRDDIRLDIEQSAEDRAWWLLLCGTIRLRPWQEVQDWIATIENSRRKREQLLWACLSCLRSIKLGEVPPTMEDEDHEADFNACLHDYLRHYKKTEFKREEITAKVSVEATILVHLAEHWGVKVEIQKRYVDHIVRLPGMEN